ncbi:MAG: segregation/condensation protein A [Candidatus Omnitrophota bacterium]
MSRYKIKLEMFEGPLDLLLYLVKKDHLNIYDIPIARVTEQYLEYIELFRLLDLEIAGEFLVMAATLMKIKSQMLLPKQETAELPEEIDPREELIEKLIEYQRYKEVAKLLRNHEEKRQEVFTRKTIGLPEDKDSEVYFEASLFELINAFSKALSEIPKDIFIEVIKDEFTVSEKMHSILHLLLIEPKLKINELFNKTKNKLEIVATFLAILELIRLREIGVMQNTVFGDIEIVKNDRNIIPLEK